jgi:hypothetical protein
MMWCKPLLGNYIYVYIYIINSTTGMNNLKIKAFCVILFSVSLEVHSKFHIDPQH